MKKVATEHVSCVADFYGTIHLPKQMPAFLPESEEGAKGGSCFQQPGSRRALLSPLPVGFTFLQN